VPRKGVKKRTLSKNFKKKKSLSKNLKDKKISIDEIPFTTIQVTMRALRWIFLLIFIYIAVSIFLLFIQGGSDSIQDIVKFSVTGFFTFFMGYYGWMFARNVLHIVSGKKPEEEF
jgi:drug/metabolite transporter (DMT)-like permease